MSFGSRRVQGLRRSEVASLAGVSVEYYTRLERGNLRGASPEVLDAIATALRLDESELAHLFDLARAANKTARPKREASFAHVSAPLQHLVDAMTDAVAVVSNARGDIVALNALARAMYEPLFTGPEGRVNFGRFVFLDPAAKTFYLDYDDIADATAGILRLQAGKNPFDREISDLVGELATRSEDFRHRWARHDVRLHARGHKRVNHPVVGTLDLDFLRLELPSEPGLDLTTYTAAPGSATAERLGLLASWWASQHQVSHHEPEPKQSLGPASDTDFTINQGGTSK